MDAVVTAGGRLQGAFAQEEGVTIKTLLTLGGKTLLERTLGALRESRSVERLCVVGPKEVEALARQCGVDLFVEESKTGIDNLLRGIEALQAEDRILCSASDLPFLRPADVDEVVERTPQEAQLSYVVSTRQEWEAAFPKSPDPFFVRLSDGEFTGGCVYVLHAPRLRSIEPLLQQAFKARKSQTGMARLLGARLTLKFLLGRFLHPRLGPSTDDLRRKVECLLGCSCAVVRGCSPRVAADVDRHQDWQYVCQVAGNLLGG